MLELKLKPSNDLDAAGKRILLTDDTGDYSTINTGGYGSSTNLRNSLAVYPIGYLNQANGNKVAIQFDPYNPLTATSWSAISSIDGWYSFSLVYAPVVQSPLITSYKEGDIVFSQDSNRLLKVSKTKLGVLTFVEAKPEELLVFNASKTLDELFLANLSFLKINLNKKKLEYLLSSENISNQAKIRVIQDAYDKVRCILQGAIYEFCIGNKYVSARYIEFLLTNNYNQL